MDEQDNSSELNSMDILAAAFFVVAGAWLIIALLYSSLVVVFLRLRARGELGSIYEEDFGRVYLCGTRFYIPFGCLFRRYIRHIQMEASSGEVVTAPINVMTRTERRQAMTILLSDDGKRSWSRGRRRETKESESKGDESTTDEEVGQSAANDTIEDGMRTPSNESDSCEDPVCSICLGEYEKGDNILRSRTCPHQFHQECILDWLQRQVNTECPCCRTSMVDEDNVWSTVKALRRSKRRKSRQRKQEQRRMKESAQSATASTDTDETVVQIYEVGSPLASISNGTHTTANIRSEPLYMEPVIAVDLGSDVCSSDRSTPEPDEANASDRV